MIKRHPFLLSLASWCFDDPGYCSRRLNNDCPLHLSIRKLCIKVTIFGFSDKKFGWFKTLTPNPFHFGNSWILRFSKVFFKEVKAEEMMMHHRLWIGFRTLKIACGFLTMLRCLEVQMTRITTRGDEKNQQSNYYFKISNNRT